MRASLSTAVLLAALALPLAAQQDSAAHSHSDPDHAAPGGGAVPAGWSVRADRGDASGASIKQEQGGLHVVTGPAIILYRADKAGKGPFHTLATFTQTKPSAHAEGYGLFFGGQSLDGAAEQYTYFLVRQDGSYLIKRREGEKTTDVSKGWVTSAAVKKTGANLLEVDHKQDPTKFRFLVNGQEVYSADAKTMPADGSVGLRVNHNLDVLVAGFDVHR
ncbi:MAG TPA: hypothetical protein VJQ44_12940 [Gemmatimonadales bacterium]|nr:hypothetical protein [Gemmatimonadales bacterium]